MTLGHERASDYLITCTLFKAPGNPTMFRLGGVMSLRRAVLLLSLLSILFLAACGGNDGDGGGGGGGGTISDYLLATDAQLNNVVVFNLRSDGTIGSSAGGPFLAGAAPSSAALNTTHGLVYVANSGSNSISSFVVNDDGSLTKVASDINSGGIKPVSIGISNGGGFLAVLNEQSFNVQVFSIDAQTGALDPWASDATAAGEPPVSMTVDPLGTFLYVTTETTVQLFDFDADTGDISFVDTVLTFDPQTITSPPLFSSDGLFLYVAGSEGGIYGFSIFDDGTVDQLDNFPVAAGTTVANIIIDSSGTLMYATDSTGAVYGFGIAPVTGALTSLPNSPYAASAGAGVMAFDPTENFLHVAQSGTINSYSIAQNGSLTKLTGQYNGGNISSMLSYEIQ
jgi:6-phosphogluconolactonase